MVMGKLIGERLTEGRSWIVGRLFVDIAVFLAASGLEEDGVIVEEK